MGKEFSVEHMKELMESVHQNQIGELLLEGEGFRLRIRGSAPAPAPVPQPLPPIPMAPAAGAPAPVPAAEPTPVAEAPAPAGRVITSPIVGTFYSAASPDAEPFVKPGQAVKAGETVFIVESMKVMNEVPADQDGIVAEVLVQDGDPVEYGQPVLRLE